MQYLFRSANDDNDDNNQGDDDGEDDKNDTNKNNELSQRLMMNDKVAFVSITLTTTIVKTKIVTMTTIIKNDWITINVLLIVITIMLTRLFSYLRLACRAGVFFCFKSATQKHMESFFDSPQLSLS